MEGLEMLDVLTLTLLSLGGAIGLSCRLGEADVVFGILLPLVGCSVLLVDML